MEVETFLVASAIDCVVAQRLARKLCEKCKQAYTPEPRRARRGRVHGVPDRGPGRVLPAVRVPVVREHRLPRPDRSVRSDADDRRDRAAHRRARVVRRDREHVAIEQGMYDAPRRRPRRRPGGPDVDRRDRKGGEVMSIAMPTSRSSRSRSPNCSRSCSSAGPRTSTSRWERRRRSGCTATSSAWSEYPILTPRGIQGMIYAILPQKMRERFEQELELDMSYSLPGQGAVPRERLPAARLGRRRVPADPVRDQDASTTSALPERRGRPRALPARVRRRHRADGLGQVDDARRDGRHREPRAAGAHHDGRGPDRVPAQAQAAAS